MNDCNDIEILLADAATSSLPPEEARRVEEHALACPACARTLDDLGALLGDHRRPVRGAVPDLYWPAILPRIRARLDERKRFDLPRYVLRLVLPAAAAVYLLVLSAQFVPTAAGSSPGDAAALLTSLPEAELSSLAEAHDSEAPIMLPAESAENASPDLDEGNILQEIVENETGVNLYAYLDPDVAVGNLAEADQIELISMLEHP